MMMESRTQRTISSAWQPATSIATTPFQSPNRRLAPTPTGFTLRWRRSHISVPHWSVRGRTRGFIPSGWHEAGPLSVTSGLAAWRDYKRPLELERDASELETSANSKVTDAID